MKQIPALSKFLSEVNISEESVDVKELEECRYREV